MFTKRTFAALSLLTSGPILVANAQTPLASKSFTYTNLPYQADTDNGDRGTQSGYNICNSGTQGSNSYCQTAIINSIDDFCLWGGPNPDSLIGNVEGEVVVWCTKPIHGARLIPSGALTGVQFVRTPDYVQVTGVINQQLVNIDADDSGGELDPYAADGRGNPIGGLVFSDAFSSSNGNPSTYSQAIQWHSFMGGGVFCLKACDPAGPNAAEFCNHIYDRLGCFYNAPAPYADNVFESCLGDSQDFPGVYTGTDGQISTYTQPPESLGPITTMPYGPKIPANSQCTTYVSSSLYSGGSTPTSTTTTSSPPAPSCASTYTAGVGDTCAKIGTKYGLTAAQILAANTYLDCSNIWQWTPVCIPPGGPSCLFTYTAQAGDTCTTIGSKFGLTATQILAANTFLDCTNVWQYTPICVPPGGTCTSTYYSVAGDTCDTIGSKYGVSGSQVLAWNTFLSCSDIWANTPVCV